jgi:hypothetical protein
MVETAAGAQITNIASGCRLAEMLDGPQFKGDTPMTRHSAILANLLLSLPVVTGLLGTAPSALAQTGTMTVTIPFAFSAGDQHLAAGSYSVERINSSFLAVRNNKTSRITVLMVRGEQGRGLQSNAHLTFQREGRGMYLTQAWFAGSSEYVQTVAKPKRDLEYAKGASPAGQVIEVASK